MLVKIFDHEELINYLTELNVHVNYKYLLINSATTINIGIVLLKAIIEKYQYPLDYIIIDCKNSIAYCIFALENNFKYILLNCNNSEVEVNINTLAMQNKGYIFNTEEKIIEYFVN
jgi:hypothetical protein